MSYSRFSKTKKKDNDLDGKRTREDIEIYLRERKSSYKEHTEDALVYGAEEGRDKLRKATVSCK